MAFSYGFFNAQNLDRVYTAEDFTAYLSSLILQWNSGYLPAVFCTNGQKFIHYIRHGQGVDQWALPDQQHLAYS